MALRRRAPLSREPAPSRYTDPRNGEIVAFERGPVGDGRDVVDEGEQLVRYETFAADAPLHELDWQQAPPIEPTPTPTPDLSNTRPDTPVRPGLTPTPTPTA